MYRAARARVFPFSQALFFVRHVCRAPPCALARGVVGKPPGCSSGNHREQGRRGFIAHRAQAWGTRARGLPPTHGTAACMMDKPPSFPLTSLLLLWHFTTWHRTAVALGASHKGTAVLAGSGVGGWTVIPPTKPIWALVVTPYPLDAGQRSGASGQHDGLQKALVSGLGSPCGLGIRFWWPTRALLLSNSCRRSTRR